jgi:hypothetical protein
MAGQVNRWKLRGTIRRDQPETPLFLSMQRLPTARYRDPDF